MLRNDDAAASPGNARERRSGMDMPGTHADSEDRTAADNTVHVADGAKSAVVADLVADELDVVGLNPDAKRLPILARIYGVLVLLDGLAVLPLVVLTCIYSVREILNGRVHVDAMSLTFILSVVYALVLIVSAVCLIVFGVLLLRNHRRYAARWTYVLMPLTLADGMLGRDQSGKGYIALDFFNIFWLFTIASVGGLIVETIYHFALYNGELQDRAGLLWGPFSPIYGCGAVLVTVCLNRMWKANPFLIFCASAVIGGAFEYCTSWFMEVAFGITAWDYTGRWLSIDGRTSGQFMFFWGLIGVVWVRWLLPRLLALINRIPWKVRYSLTAVCAVLMVIDIVFTLMALDCWYGRMAGQPQTSPVAMWFSERYSDAYMANRFQTMHLDPSKAGRM